MQLSQAYKNQLLPRLLNETFDLESDLDFLTQQGFDREEARTLIHKELIRLQKHALEDAKREKEESENEKAALLITMMISVIGPIFEINSLLYYFIVITAVGALGFWGYKRTPIAGVVSCALVAILMPIFLLWYMSGRSSVIKIELLIPIVLSAVPAYLVGLGIKKVVYENKKPEV